MSRTIAFLAGLGAGFKDETDRKDRKARLDRQEAREEERYQFDKSERERVQADRKLVRDAAAPVAVVEEGGLPATMDNRDVGQPGEAAVAPQTFRVGAQSFASRGVADQAATAQRDTNMATALDSVDPAGAIGRKAARTQASAGEAQLRKLTEDMIREGTLDALGAAMQGASVDEIKALYNRAGKGRVAELTVEPFEFNHPTLGKQRSAKLVGRMEDGTPIQVNDAFAQSLQLFGTAKRLGVETEWQKMKDARDDKAADNDRQDKAEQRRGVHEDRMYSAQLRATSAAERAAATAAAKAAAGPAAAQVTLKDKREFESDFDGHIKDRFPVKEGATQQERDAHAAEATRLRAMGQTMFQTNSTAGNLVTAGTVGQAIELARDRKNVRVFNVNGQSYEGVIVNGQPVITSAALERRQPAADAPGGAVVENRRQPVPVGGQGAMPPGAGAMSPASVPSASSAANMAAQGVPAAQAQQPGAALSPEHLQVLKPLSDIIAGVAQQLVAAGNSGDTTSINKLAQQLQQLKAQRAAEAVRRLGPNVAEQYLSTLPV